MNEIKINLNTIDYEMNFDSDSDTLNYSIVRNIPEYPESELKIKLRLSSKQKTNMSTNITPSIKSLTLSANESPHLTRSKRKTIDVHTPFKDKLQRRKSILITEELETEIQTPKKISLKTPKNIRSAGISTPTMIKRSSICSNSKSDLHIAREKLHVSSVPTSLPCREMEFDNICNFLEDKILDESSGCMYISGVPGTGKTATTSEVIRYLKDKSKKEEIPCFKFIEINGMRLSEPKQAYVQIYQQLVGKSVSADQAHSLLEKRFTTLSASGSHITTVLLVDELDMLCNRRQDVVYNLLDWPSKKSSRLVVITIANTMDLPERLLMGKVTSRLGLTRLTFQPYTYKQLEEIVNSRLSGFKSFKSDAIQLIARKVAAVSGDARRALDICRRATEIAEEEVEMNNEIKPIVNMMHVQKALAGMIASPKVQAIKNCSRFEQIFLQAIAAEILRTGIEETSFNGVYVQFQSIIAFMGLSCPSIGKALKLCTKLGSERLLICEHSRTDIFQKIFLNVSTDDIHYALQVKID